MTEEWGLISMPSVPNKKCYSRLSLCLHLYSTIVKHNSDEGMYVQSPAVATQHHRWSLFSVSISVVGVDRRPNDVCERGMVSYIRIIASHLLGLNNLWDIIKKLHLASVLRPPPAKPSRRLYCQCEPSATLGGRRNLKAKQWHVDSSTRYKFTHP